MLQSLFDTLFGCSHQRTTFPLTPARRNAGAALSSTQRNSTYVTCLDCGKEFAYDWKAMRIGQPVVARVPAVETQPSYR
jgi:RNase P subunit RPR2